MTHIAEKIEGLFKKQEKGDVRGAEKSSRQKKLDDTRDDISLLYQYAPVGILVINQEKIIKKFNREAEKIFGFTADEIIGKHLVTLIPERYRNFHYRPFGAVMGQPENCSKTYEFIGLKKNGEEFSVELSFCLTTQDTERFMVVTARDISSRKSLENEMRERTDILQDYLKLHNQWLAETEEKYSALFKASRTGALFLREDMTIFDCNSIAEEMLARKKTEIIGKKLIDVMPEPERKTAAEVLPKIFSDIIKFDVEKIMNGHLKGVGQQQMPVEFYFRKITNELKQHIVCIMRDIAIMRQAEDQLIKSQKFESLGILMWGMMLNFKNILASIMGYTSIIKSSVEIDARLMRYLNTIETSCAHAVDVSRKVLHLGKVRDDGKTVVNINTLVEHSVKLFEECIDKRYKIQVELDLSLRSTEVNECHFNQMLLNLLINAHDAMPDGGTILLKTQNMFLNDEACKNYQNVTGGNFVEISVQDTGIGMPEDIQKKIFDPYFTTKDESIGTGLGLATVERIAKNHRGFVTVFSKEGEGTTFKIYLPATGEPHAVVTDAETATKRRPREETILAVDDENIIIRTIRESLGSMGYHVITASNGCEAVKLFNENRSKIDLVVLDLMMPAMNGYEAFKEIKAMDPHTKIILCTGYVADNSVQEMMNSGVKGLLKKPYRIEDLSRAVRLVLDEQASGTA